MGFALSSMLAADKGERKSVHMGAEAAVQSKTAGGARRSENSGARLQCAV
jgi:hypothetical protein